MRHLSVDPAMPAGRFLSAVECQALIHRVLDFTAGGGDIDITLMSRWSGNLRWARNQIISSGDIRDNTMGITRTIRGARGISSVNAFDDRHLRLTVERAERIAGMQHELLAYQQPAPPFIEPYLKPTIWFDATYNQDAAQRSALMRSLVQPARAAGMHAAGFIQVSAFGKATVNADRVWYYPCTQAEYSVTVRTPDGSGSGWAGVDSCDWTRIDAVQLTHVALEKCLRARKAVRIEPGRYTTILEPQAVCDLVRNLFTLGYLGRFNAEGGEPKGAVPDPNFVGELRSPFNKSPGFSKLGDTVIDERLSLRVDCTDPDLGFAPFSGWEVFKPATIISDGVLTALPYNREYAVRKLGLNTGFAMWSVGYFEGALHMTTRGETASVEEMIATTKRGILVTRFDNVRLLSGPSVLLSGFTRDGLWLVENGKISKAIRNFRFTDSPLHALNKVEQVGVPQRVYSPNFPYIVPALKVRDFSFTGLSDAS